MDNGSEYKKAKGTKTGVIKRRLMFEITKIACLMKKTYLKSNETLKVLS